ncbi:MAG TPA: hypothetical protein VGI64_16930 [Streptosporangiaceae bacterium]|jgi:hypothetical protein
MIDMSLVTGSLIAIAVTCGAAILLSLAVVGIAAMGRHQELRRELVRASREPLVPAATALAGSQRH